MKTFKITIECDGCEQCDDTNEKTFKVTVECGGCVRCVECDDTNEKTYRTFVERTKSEGTKKEPYKNFVECVEQTIIKYYDKVKEKKYLMGNERGSGGVGKFAEFYHDREKGEIGRIHRDSLVKTLIKAAEANSTLKEEIKKGKRYLRVDEKYRCNKNKIEVYIDLYVKDAKPPTK